MARPRAGSLFASGVKAQGLRPAPHEGLDRPSWSISTAATRGAVGQQPGGAWTIIPSGRSHTTTRWRMQRGRASLPDEAVEFAARGGRSGKMYPWGDEFTPSSHPADPALRATNDGPRHGHRQYPSLPVAATALPL